MAIFKNRSGGYFSAIDSRVIRQRMLSLRALGLLAVMLDHPVTWKLRVSELARTQNVPNGEIVAAIRRIAAGRRVVSPEIENMLANNPPVQELSPRQRDILESITRGLTNAQIALQLDISPESVKTHIARLFEKLGASNRSEAVTIALRRHLLKI